MHVAFLFDIGVSTCDSGCDLIAHYFLLPNNNLLYGCALYIHSLIEGHLNDFQSLLIMDKTEICLKVAELAKVSHSFR